MECNSFLYRGKLSSDMTAPDPFKEELQTVMENEGLTLENLYNCDETGLCYRMLPTKTLASRYGSTWNEETKR